MAHGAFGFEINNSKSSFTEALQKVVDVMSKIGIRENNKPPVVLRTVGYNDKHLKDASKQSGVSPEGLKKLIHNFNNAKIDWDYMAKLKGGKKKLKEETPTNSMGQSSTATGPIRTVDPLLKRKPLKRLKAFLKP